MALGGVLDPNLVGGQSKEQHLPFHTADDAKGLRGANTADVLLTSMWPQGVWAGSHVALDPAQQAATSQPLLALSSTRESRSCTLRRKNRTGHP